MAATGEETAVAALWDCGCLGVQVETRGRTARARVHLLTWFAAARPAATIRRMLAAALARGGLPRVRLRFDVAWHEPWVERWQRTLRPMAIGRSFLIVPERRSAPPSGRRIVIRMRFGQAFGTGEHASTRLCLRLLERRLRPGARVADVGTGTGVLAMAAARLGAVSVVAFDDDPVALAVARANLADNALTRRVRLRLADAGAIRASGRFDMVMMNIGAAVIERALPDLTAALATSGAAVVAGFLREDEGRLADRARDCGLHAVSRLRSGPWSALLLERHADSPGRP